MHKKLRENDERKGRKIGKTMRYMRWIGEDKEIKMPKIVNTLKHINKNTKIVILGTFPSEESRKSWFYHKSTNQFWPILSKLYNCKDICHLSKEHISQDTEKLIKRRMEFLTEHRIGLWDIIKSCDIKGSSDSSIKNPIYNDITTLKTECPELERIYFSSKKAFQYYQKYLKQIDNYPNLKDRVYKKWLEKIVVKDALPSPSSANARMTLTQKQEKWSMLLGLSNNK